MNQRPVYPIGFDPRHGLTTSALAELASLHLLLHERLTVQDAFLISRLFRDTSEARPQNSPREWLDRGWLTIALRDEVTSLADLKDMLLQKALEGDYRPFEDFDEGIKLYRDGAFAQYLASLDAELSMPDRIAPWNAAATGAGFAKQMLASARDGRSGLSPDRALSIWNEVDQRGESAHSRTLYYALADSLASSEEADVVRAWASREYFVALPDTLDLQVSAPASVLRAVRADDPFAALRSAAISPLDTAALRGRDCALLSSLFLSKIDADGIATIRKLPEFGTLQSAQLSRSPERLHGALLEYLRAIGDLAPGLIDSSVNKLEAFKRAQLALSVVGGVAGIVLTGSIGDAAGIAAIFLGLTGWTESRHGRATRAALTEAAYAPRAGVGDPIADFAHDDK